MNDIKTLPFDKIYPRAEALMESKQEDLLSLLKGQIQSTNTRKIESLTRMLARNGNYEEGSDGYEESARESLNLPDPEEAELDEEALSDIKGEAIEETVDSFIKGTNLALGHTWVLPQLIAHVGREWSVVRGEDGLIDGAATVMKNVANSDFDKGVWAVMMTDRNKLATWAKGSKYRWYNIHEYNHLVPLILNGFKIYQNINYSEWSKDTLMRVVDAELCSAMLTVPPEMSTEDILALRQHGLTIGSGVKAGEMRAVETTFGLAHLDSYTTYDLTGLNKLSIIMLAQIHAAHPSNAKPRYQVLSPLDWDNAPEPLVPTKVVSTGLWTPKSKFKAAPSPW